MSATVVTDVVAVDITIITANLTGTIIVMCEAHDMTAATPATMIATMTDVATVTAPTLEATEAMTAIITHTMTATCGNNDAVTETTATAYRTSMTRPLLRLDIAEAVVAVAASQIMATGEAKPEEASDAEHMDVAEDVIDKDIGAIFVRAILREGMATNCERARMKELFFLILFCTRVSKTRGLVTENLRIFFPVCH